MESAVDLLSAAAQAKGLDIGALFDSAIPSVLRGDAGRLRQILANLTSNAVKFTTSGAVIIHVTLEEEHDDRVHVRFSATGIGIPADVIGKELVERMGGTIGVESTAGQGSTFWFSLPLERTGAELQEARPALQLLQGVRALIVDDSETNRRIIRHNLASWRIVSADAADADQALHELQDARRRAEPFDIAIVDLDMPRTDGLSLSRLIKSDPAISSTHVILVTSMVTRVEGSILQSIGIDSCLTRPVKQSALFDAIAGAMSNPPAAPRSAAAPSEPLELRSNARVLVAEDDPSGQPVLDPEAVDHLRTLDDGSGTFLSEIAEVFLSDAPPRMEAIRRAVKENDATAMAREAHAFKSSAANVGATELRDLCALLERIGAHGSVAGAPERLGDLAAAYSRTAEAIRKFLAPAPPR